VVSNNSAEAVRAYLAARRLGDLVASVVARYDGMDPRLLKPDDHLVRMALTELASPPAAAVFIGDSRSDIDAGRTAGVPTIGYANKPAKRQGFLDAGADAVIDTMTELADALTAAPRPS
jgi:phosphoglycolate phosphatase